MIGKGDEMNIYYQEIGPKRSIVLRGKGFLLHLLGFGKEFKKFVHDQVQIRTGLCADLYASHLIHINLSCLFQKWFFRLIKIFLIYCQNNRSIRK